MVQTRVSIQNPFATQHKAPAMAPVRLFTNQRMYRKSDGRLMMVSSSEKLLSGTAMQDLPFFQELAASGYP